MTENPTKPTYQHTIVGDLIKVFFIFCIGRVMKAVSSLLCAENNEMIANQLQ